MSDTMQPLLSVSLCPDVLRNRDSVLGCVDTLGTAKVLQSTP